MEIIIGREDNTSSRLCIECNGNVKYINTTVPMSVARKHLRITITDDDILLENLDPKHDTWVNARRFERCHISMSSDIQLGKNHFKLELAPVFKELGLPISVSHLKKVWDEFHNKELSIIKNEKRMSALPMICGTGLSLLCFAFGVNRDNPTIMIAAAVILGLSFGYKMLFPAKDIEKKEKLNDWLRENYVCPCCNKFLGKQKYDYILNDGACPHCKVKYTGR